MSKKVNKRKVDDGNNFEQDISSCLHGFGSDIKKARQSKVEVMKRSTKESVQKTLSPVMELMEKQAEERQKISDKFYSNMSDLFKEGENYLQKAEKADRDMQKVVRMHKKSAQQMIQFKSDNFDDLKQTSDHFFQSLDNLHQTQMEQLAELEDSLKTDLSQRREKTIHDYCKQATVDPRNTMHFWAA